MDTSQKISLFLCKADNNYGPPFWISESVLKKNILNLSLICPAHTEFGFVFKNNLAVLSVFENVEWEN